MVPPPTAPESVSCILYYSDVDDCLGPTAFKPLPEHHGDQASEETWRLAEHGTIGMAASQLLSEDELAEHPDPASRNFTTHRTIQQRPDLYEVSPGAQRRA